MADPPRLVFGLVPPPSFTGSDARVGSLHVNVIRPFPEAAVITALRGKKNVIVLETGKNVYPDATGSLRLEKADGSTVLLHSGEVTIGSASAAR